MTKKACVVLAALVGLVGFGEARADPITYTFTGTASGSLGANAFTNASFTIVSTADTSQVTMTGPGIFHIPDLTATVSVAGLGTAAFTIPTINVSNQNLPGAGFSAPDQDLAILFELNQAFASYDLTTSIGPLSGPPEFNSGFHFATTSGDFVLNSVSGDVTFTAQASPAPEPSALALFGLGAAALAGWRWRQRRRAA
jgi:hypothetical protein